MGVIPAYSTRQPREVTRQQIPISLPCPANRTSITVASTPAFLVSSRVQQGDRVQEDEMGRARRRKGKVSNHPTTTILTLGANHNPPPQGYQLQLQVRIRIRTLSAAGLGCQHPAGGLALADLAAVDDDFISRTENRLTATHAPRRVQREHLDWSPRSSTSVALPCRYLSRSFW
ncbi:hypothetical protein GY45DRAFT_336014 [Cubamyces sp. BRFM 1775]|nr:hypothetical protein GY45DRAFT_336014 [Cubamyces sp. BRFM 1775]